MKIFELGKYNCSKGKAGTLNRLYKQFNVARGFIIDSSVFDEFLKYNNILLSSKIKEDIMLGAFPFEEELLRYFKKNNYRKVIVRSSASIEDGSNYSFAGQFESYTNTDINTLVLNIKKCWVSMFNDNVIEYLERKKLTHNFKFDILIQEMIVSEEAGIAFSINPSTGKEEFVINISNSQCENIVNGEVIPNTYYIKNKSAACGNIEIAIENLERLKRIFKKNIEIEFGFKNNIFYLFQVRPITKVYFSLSNYINTEFWCSFKNNNWNLFNRSLWILGASKYKNPKINNKITEDITICYPYNEKQVRAFNGNQPPLDQITIKSHSIEDVNTYIDEYNNVVQSINKVSITIKENITKNKFNLFNKNLKEIIKYNAIINSYEYLIGSLGQSLYSELDNKTLQNFYNWRNSEDNSYFPIYKDIFNYVLKYFNINMDIVKFKTYIHVEELLKLCDKKISTATIIRRIKKREKNGFLLLNLHNNKFNNKVIINKKIYNTVKNKFQAIQNNTHKEKGIKGQSTFKNGKIIKGECVVISDNNFSSINLENKIVVCEITTAKDIKYIKNVKALIVNSGGILCHSAIFSREFNIPCLMGCYNATDYFKTGDIISMDLDNEIAKKLNNKFKN